MVTRKYRSDRPPHETVEAALAVAVLVAIFLAAVVLTVMSGR